MLDIETFFQLPYIRGIAMKKARKAARTSSITCKHVMFTKKRTMKGGRLSVRGDSQSGLG